VSSLSYGLTYYWRVSARNVSGESGFSSIWHFGTIYPVPTVPVLVSPSNGAQNQSSLALLKWHKSDSTTIDYQLQVATDSNFASLTYNDSTITDTSRMMTTLLHANTSCWHV